MRAAEAIELRNAQQMRGGESLRRGLGRDHSDALDARHLRGNRGHQQRGGQRMTAAGHIATHRAERTNKLAGGEAGDGFIAPGGGQLRNGKGANLIGGGGESLAHRGIDGLPRGGHLFRRNAQSTRAGEAVELRGIAQQSAVALLAHIGDDALDGGQHSIERRAAALFESGEEFRCLPRAASFGSDELHPVLPCLHPFEFMRLRKRVSLARSKKRQCTQLSSPRTLFLF